MNPRFSFAAGLIVTLLCLPNTGISQEATGTAAFNRLDKNADGKLSRDEAPNKEVFGDVDTDQDGFASLSEVNTWLSTVLFQMRHRRINRRKLDRIELSCQTTSKNDR